jgi:type I restriction enzyme R subunit
VILHGFTESVVKDAALAWLESLGWSVKHGLEIAPGELVPKNIFEGNA